MDGLLVYRTYGRKFRFIHNDQQVFTKGCYPPRKGEWFLRPTGKRGIWQLEIAQQDHTKKNYLIIEK